MDREDQGTLNAGWVARVIANLKSHREWDEARVSHYFGSGGDNTTSLTIKEAVQRVSLMRHLTTSRALASDFDPCPDLLNPKS